MILSAVYLFHFPVNYNRVLCVFSLNASFKEEEICTLAFFISSPNDLLFIYKIILRVEKK